MHGCVTQELTSIRSGSHVPLCREGSCRHLRPSLPGNNQSLILQENLFSLFYLNLCFLTSRTQQPVTSGSHSRRSDNMLRSALGLPVSEEGHCCPARGPSKVSCSIHISLQLAGYFHTMGFLWDHRHPALVPKGAPINAAQISCLLLPDQEKLVQWDK